MIVMLLTVGFINDFTSKAMIGYNNKRTNTKTLNIMSSRNRSFIFSSLSQSEALNLCTLFLALKEALKY